MSKAQIKSEIRNWGGGPRRVWTYTVPRTGNSGPSMSGLLGTWEEARDAVCRALKGRS